MNQITHFILINPF